jgi:hypothetical protein
LRKSWYQCGPVHFTMHGKYMFSIITQVNIKYSAHCLVSNFVIFRYIRRAVNIGSSIRTFRCFSLLVASKFVQHFVFF